MPDGARPRDLLPGVLIPGYAFGLRRDARLGRLLMLAGAVLLLLGFAGLGRFWGAASVALLVGLHGASLVEFLRPWLMECRRGLRLITSVAAVAALLLGVYLPFQAVVARHVAVPVRHGDQVIVVRPTSDWTGVGRGTWVAYTLPDDQASGVIVIGGVSLGPVLARAGDTVEFLGAQIRVGDGLLPAKAGMPAEGRVTVRAGQWFIWPELRVHRAGGGSVENALYQYAFVSYDALVGRPYEHWFFRRQVMP